MNERPNDGDESAKDIAEETAAQVNTTDTTQSTEADNASEASTVSAPAEKTEGAAASQEVPAGWYPDQRLGSGQQRYWDGSAWTDKTSDHGQVPTGTHAPTVSTERRAPDERKAILAQQIQFAAARGRRIESQGDYQAVLVSGQPVNHTLHAILTIFTCLIWGIVWAIIAGTGGEKREMIVVDEFGNVQHTKLGKV